MEDNLLLEKIRALKEAFLHNYDQEEILAQSGEILAGVIGSLTIIAEPDGTILSVSQSYQPKTEGRMERMLGENTLAGEEVIMEMITSKGGLFNRSYADQHKKMGENEPAAVDQGLLYSVIPVWSQGRHIASIVHYHPGRNLDKGEVAVAEVGAALVGMALYRATLQKYEKMERNRQLAEVAFDSLSYSEVEAIREVIKNIVDNESIVVASKIADNLGITRSVIVNALRKFESAGIIESRSLGMKGTMIRVTNEEALKIIANSSEHLPDLS